jgi:hypothetical protein
MRKIMRRLFDFKLAVIGHKPGNEPDWLRIRSLAQVQAMAEESDSRALVAIEDEVRSHVEAAREARQRLAPHISCYDGDRAVRLLDAALSGSPVHPIRAECVELFGEEARLGRMPLREAFAELASREPELERIMQGFEERHAALMASIDESPEVPPRSAGFVMLRDAQQEVDRIIGTKARHADPLLRSYLPRNIAFSWLAVISGGPPHMDPDASYFSTLAVGRPSDQ